MFLESTGALLRLLKLEEVSPKDVKVGDIILHPQSNQVALVEVIKKLDWPWMGESDAKPADQPLGYFEFASQPTWDGYINSFSVKEDRKVLMVPRDWKKDI